MSGIGVGTVDCFYIVETWQVILPCAFGYARGAPGNMTQEAVVIRHFPDSLARLRRRAVFAYYTVPAVAPTTFGTLSPSPGSPMGSRGGNWPATPRGTGRFPYWAHKPPGIVVTGARVSVLPGHHEGAMPGTGGRGWMRSRMAAKSRRGIATSAIWKITSRAWVTTLVPILMSPPQADCRGSTPGQTIGGVRACRIMGAISLAVREIRSYGRVSSGEYRGGGGGDFG